ncbi:MAG: hypothetical protein ABIO86_06270 [Sphingomonas sp.]
MSEKPTDAQLWEQDRALLAEHGASHIADICQTIDVKRAEGREAEAIELEEQCGRMRVILMSDAELWTAYETTGGGDGDREADGLRHEVRFRGLDDLRG